MCTTDVYTYIYPDGHQKNVHHPTLCPFSHRNQVCANNTFVPHRPQYVTYSGTASSSPNLGMAAPYISQMPPTPTYTPRTATPVHRSGDESDRSHHSGSSSSRKRSPVVYINGQKVHNLDHRRGSSSRRERVVLVDSPQRTPPQAFPASMSAPSSPSSAPYIINTPPRESPRRPIIVDGRGHETSNALHIDPFVGTATGHRRHGSTSSRESRHSSHASDEDKAARRQRRREAAEAQARQEKTRERIAKANARIANRPAVPAAPAPPVRRSSTMGTTSTTAATTGSSSPPRKSSTTPPYVRPHVEVHSDKDAELADAVRRLSFEEELREEKARKLERREGRSRVRDEDEAQRQRLLERLTPVKRRSTVSHGSRRSKVFYDDGSY